jgi:excinuclease ABC subunit C
MRTLVGKEGSFMSELFAKTPFSTFGPSAYLSTTAPVNQVTRTPSAKSAKLRAQVRLLAPRQPAVYGMIDCHDELIYIGKAKNLRARLLSYFRPRSRPRKVGKIISHAAAILWEVCPGEFASLLRELELIRRWRPRFNVQGQPLRRRQTFLCLGRSPAPYAFLAVNPPHTAISVYGPIPAGDRAAEAVRRLNDCFQLRDCPQSIEMVFPDQGELFPPVRPAGCPRLDLGSCLGPCTGTCSRDTYQTQVQQARDFLNGKSPGPLSTLARQMQDAATAQQYERAAALRDRLAPLQWLKGRLERLRYARQKMSFVYPVAGRDGGQTWYLIHGARVLAALPAPKDATGKERARTAIEAAFRDGRAPWLREAYEHADGMMLVLAWFRKHPEEMQRTMTPEEALAACCGPTG